jgi:uncharacterized protein with WD repeat
MSNDKILDNEINKAKTYSFYLRKYSKLSSEEMKKSREQNKEFWNEFFDESKLEEDVIPRKYPNPKQSLLPNQLPELNLYYKDQE